MTRVALLTREFPPEVYGGAGVHVEHLVPALARYVEVDVHCFGAPRASDVVAGAYQPWDALAGSGALEVMSVDLAMAGGVAGADLVHSHTWYANLGGHLAKLLHGIPHVMTSHSIEPLRPWKEQQLGGGYALSLFCERTAVESADAVVAVSDATRADLLKVYPTLDPARVRVIHNGVDTATYHPDPATAALARLGVDERRPYVLFVGRITRQKGIAHLLAAAEHLDASAQLVLCAAAPDSEAEGDEVRRAVAALGRRRDGVILVEEHLPRADVVQLLSSAAVFACPSVYEPFGLVNVEAMACGAPVVATATGGSPEIVVDGETGFLVPLDGTSEGPHDPAAFAADLADRINRLLADPPTARRFGEAGRRRAVEHFSWSAVARRTADLYAEVISSR